VTHIWNPYAYRLRASQFEYKADFWDGYEFVTHIWNPYDSFHTRVTNSYPFPLRALQYEYKADFRESVAGSGEVKESQVKESVERVQAGLAGLRAERDALWCMIEQGRAELAHQQVQITATTAAHCNTLQLIEQGRAELAHQQVQITATTAAHCNTLQLIEQGRAELAHQQVQITATTAAHCNMLQLIEQGRAELAHEQYALALHTQQSETASLSLNTSQQHLKLVSPQQRVAVCCSVLQTALQCVAVCCNVLQCVAMCCRLRCSVLQCVVATERKPHAHT